VLRATNNTALGATGTGATQITNIVGNTGGSGRLELAGDITVGETIQIEARQAATLNTPALSNFSGNNTVTAQVIGTTGGSTYNVESQSGTLTLGGGFALTGSATGTRFLQLMGAGTGVVSGVIANGVGVVAVNKFGTGTWALTGAATNSGAWVITDGTVLANNTAGSATGTGPVTVSGTATFGGTGSISGALTINPGATLAPGASIGTLTTTNAVTFGTTGAGAPPTLAVELAQSPAPVPGTDNDLLVLSGAGAAGMLTLTNPDQLNLIAPSGITGTATYTIATFASQTGTFDNVLINGLDIDQDAVPTDPNYVALTYNPTNIQVTVNNLSPIPEPAALGLLGIAGTALMGRRRRRRVR
jgi:hypothetical protein